LDVRTNDDGDLVVTKGDQYDVREKADGGDAGAAAGHSDGTAAAARPVRNLGKPVDLSARYYEEVSVVSDAEGNRVARSGCPRIRARYTLAGSCAGGGLPPAVTPRVILLLDSVVAVALCSNAGFMRSCIFTRLFPHCTRCARTILWHRRAPTK
jgi:hypothetical protein